MGAETAHCSGAAAAAAVCGSVRLCATVCGSALRAALTNTDRNSQTERPPPESRKTRPAARNGESVTDRCFQNTKTHFSRCRKMILAQVKFFSVDFFSFPALLPWPRLGGPP